MSLDHVDMALSQVGVREATGRNDGPDVKRYALEEGFAWCAAFVCWCFDHAGTPIHRNLADRYRLRSVSAMEARASKLGVFMGHGIIPRRGDVVFFANTAGSAKHVGIVTGVEADIVHTVEGNTGDAVRQISYPRTSRRITGYARFLDAPAR